MKNNKYLHILVALAVLTVLAGAIPVLADNTNQPNNNAWNGMMHKDANRNNKGMMKPFMVGTVSSVSGNIITITSKKGFDVNAVTATFTVDATNAK